MAMPSDERQDVTVPRFITAGVPALELLSFSGCPAPGGETFSIENRTTVNIQIMSNGEPMFDSGSPARKLTPGEIITTYGTPAFLQQRNRIQAIDQQRHIHFDERLTRDDFIAREGRLLIR
ncbi:MAG: hypothetical protein NTZ05_03315 [Chloroflexi bacterium]|nr:hypothetical protein [Chloroflexota bacterium]